MVQHKPDGFDQNVDRPTAGKPVSGLVGVVDFESVLLLDVESLKIVDIVRKKTVVKDLEDHLTVLY